MCTRRSPLSALGAWVATVALAAAGPCMSASDAAAGATPPSASTDAQHQRVLDRIEAVGRRGFLYEVAKPLADGTIGKRLFLYGTIHVGRIGIEPFNAPLMGALRNSRRLALEADPSNAATAQQLVFALGQYPSDDGLQHHVTAALLERVRAFGRASGMPTGRVERFRPWLLASMVTLHEVAGAGLDADLGTERYLAGYAHAVGLPVVEVEGLDAQLTLLSTLPDALQAAQLDEALTEASGAGASDTSGALFEVWLTGDRAAADALVDRMHRDIGDKRFERYFVEELIDARDRTMADQAERYLERPGNTLFAVGALHLFGENGLVREFARRGYRVTDLQPPWSAPAAATP